MYISEGHGKAFVDVPIDDIKHIIKGLDKLLDLEARQPKKRRTAREGEALENLLRKLAEPKEYACLHIWSTDDVFAQARERRMLSRVTTAKAREIIAHLESHIDSSTGVSWDSIDYYLDDLK